MRCTTTVLALAWSPANTLNEEEEREEEEEEEEEEEGNDCILLQVQLGTPVKS